MTWLELAQGPARIGLTAGLFALLFAAEVAQAPRSGRPRDRSRRWVLNLVLFGASAASLRLLVFAGPVAAAVVAQEAGWGVFPVLGAPVWLAAVLAFLALDLALYAQHRAMHAVPLLWRLHRVHHTDPTLDVTTAFRFHPGEIVASMAWKGLVVVALGAPPLAVAVFEIWLALGAAFTHADIRLPRQVDKSVRAVIATPAVHERHHDVALAGQHSNYSGTLTLWDRLFGSYSRPEARGVARLGVAGVEAPLAADLVRGLLDPFAPDAAPRPPHR